MKIPTAPDDSNLIKYDEKRARKWMRDTTISMLWVQVKHLFVSFITLLLVVAFLALVFYSGKSVWVFVGWLFERLPWNH